MVRYLKERIPDKVDFKRMDYVTPRGGLIWRENPGIRLEVFEYNKPILGRQLENGEYETYNEVTTGFILHVEDERIPFESFDRKFRSAVRFSDLVKYDKNAEQRIFSSEKARTLTWTDIEHNPEYARYTFCGDVLREIADLLRAYYPERYEDEEEEEDEEE